jgi:hypothetical protein
LTLAVAREWDRQRALHGPTTLPHLAAIELTDTGGVVFLVNPPADHDSHDAGALSHLLAQLLRINDDAPRQPLPGGLLITISGRLGNLELPSATAEGFRAALARFADDTPHALRGIYWRTMTARSKESRPHRRSASPTRYKDRRATNAQVNELRRSIRKLEQHVFEWSEVAPQPSRGTRIPGWIAKPTAVAATVVLFIVSAFTLAGAWFLQPGGSRATTAPPMQTQSAATTDDSTPTVAATVTPAAAPVRVVPTSRRVAVSNSSRPRVNVRRVRDAEPSVRKPAAVFAGGTRGIAWLTP